MESVFLNGGMIGTTLDFGATDRYVIGTTQQRGTISYVGGRTQTSTATADFTVSLTGLTGGIGTAPIQGDLVLVARSWAAGAAADRTMSTSSTGWTEIVELYTNDTFSTNFALYYKIMTATPDTSITLNLHTAGDSSAIAVQVYRGVDLTTPIDVTQTTSTSVDTSRPNPAAITPTTTNSIIIAAGGAAHNGGVDTFTAGYLSNFITVGADSTNDSTVGMGWVSWTSGAYDPAAWGHSQADSTSFSAAALTMAIRPALVDVPILGNLKNSGIWNLQAVFDYFYIPPVAPGQQLFTSTTTWVVPAGLTEISAVAIGGGGGGAGGESGRNEGVTGGGGGGLSYGTFAVTPGETLTITVGNGGNGGTTGNNGSAGGASSIARGATVLLQGGGGGAGIERSTATVAGGTSTGTEREGGGTGGTSGGTLDTGGGGGGAAGYSGNGGAGGTSGAGSNGAGGGGGGGGATNSGQGYGGGGVNPLGEGTSGTGGSLNAIGTGGSSGANGTRPAGGAYGGGGGACDDDTSGSGGNGGAGVVRIIWGVGRAYPSTNTGDV